MVLACVVRADCISAHHGRTKSADASEILSSAYSGQDLTFGRNYMISKPFDPRLITVIPPAVAKAAMDSGVATRPIKDFNVYLEQ